MDRQDHSLSADLMLAPYTLRLKGERSLYQGIADDDWVLILNTAGHITLVGQVPVNSQQYAGVLISSGGQLDMVNHPRQYKTPNRSQLGIFLGEPGMVHLLGGRSPLLARQGEVS